MDDDGYIWLKDGDFFKKNDELHDSKTDVWFVIPDRLIGKAYPSVQQGRRKIHKQKTEEHTTVKIAKEITQGGQSWLKKILKSLSKK